MIREILERIMREYPVARTEPFAKHPLASWLRQDVPKIFREATPHYANLIWVASPGHGKWATAPWIAAFDPLVTQSAQEGWYPVYLFSRSCRTVYLSLIQGVTAVHREFGLAAKIVLEKRAVVIRSRIQPYLPLRFSQFLLDLTEGHDPEPLLAFYEAGHVVGVCYRHDALPSDDTLLKDLLSMLDLYSKATALGGPEDFSTVGLEPEYEAEQGDTAPSLEEKRQMRFHLRIERNRRLAELAKKVHGCRCQICGFDFGEEYGSFATGYIEAHHLVPFADLPVGRTVHLSPDTDFAVVCANCHRMLHRPGSPTPFSAFRAAYQTRKAFQEHRRESEESNNTARKGPQGVPG